MKKEGFRALISLVIFILGVAITLPMATGVLLDKLPGHGEITEPDDYPDFPGDPTDTDSEITSDVPAGTTDGVTTETQDTGITSAMPDDSSSDPVIITEPVTTEDITTLPPVTTVPVVTTSPEELTRPPYTGADFPWTKVGASYFSDALFIGDSRTVGIRNASAGRLASAVFFCDIGVSASKAMNNRYEATTGADTSGKYTKLGTFTLTDLLKSRTFRKIYIMVGVNELGGSIGGITNNIKKLLETVRAACPDAIVFMEANLHFTAEADKRYASQGKDYMSNARMYQVNSNIADMADWDRVFYIDINEIFDIAGGTFNPEYSGDGVHPTARYYREWADWFYTKGVIKQG